MDNLPIMEHDMFVCLERLALQIIKVFYKAPEDEHSQFSDEKKIVQEGTLLNIK